MNINDVVTWINTASLIWWKLLNAANTAENIYDFFNWDENKLNSIKKRGILAMTEYNNYLNTNNIKWDEAYKITEMELSEEGMTPKKEDFYIWAYNEWYFHIEELEDLWIDISKLWKNDLKMKELAIKLYYGWSKIPEWIDDAFEEWKENNWFDYGKILEAKENVKKNIEKTLEKKGKKIVNNINFTGKKDLKNDKDDSKNWDDWEDWDDSDWDYDLDIA